LAEGEIDGKEIRGREEEEKSSRFST